MIRIENKYLSMNNEEVIMKTAAYLIINIFAFLLQFLFRKSKPAH